MASKFEFGNALIYEPTGRMHFVNQKKGKYYWTARTKGFPYKLIKGENVDYFGFEDSDNELYYFCKSGSKKNINLNDLKQEVASINEDRVDGDKFYVDEADTIFWIDILNGNEYFNEKEVATKKLDLIEFQRKDCHIWHDNDKQMDLHFGILVKCIGPCLCKKNHVEADYAPPQVKQHNFRNQDQFERQFRRYVDLLDFEKSHNLPNLPKSDLIVQFDKPVHEGVYYGVFKGHLEVVVVEVRDAISKETDELCNNLYKLNGSIHFVRFFGKYEDEIEKRYFLVFEAFSKADTKKDLPRLSKEGLLQNLRGLIRGIAFMQSLPFSIDMWGNIGRPGVVVVEDDQGQSTLKIFIKGPGQKGKNKIDDLKGLASIIDHYLHLFDTVISPESEHLIECLRDGSYDIISLTEHLTFWTPFQRLEFVCDVYTVLDVYAPFHRSLHTIKQAVASHQAGMIHRKFFARMELFGSYALGRKTSRIAQLVRLIRHAKNHDLEIPKNVRLLYKESRVGLEEYFRVRFPYLVPELYKLVQKTCAWHTALEQYAICPHT